MDVLPKPKRRRTHAKRFCEHCNCFVSKTTWYNHRHIASQGSRGVDSEEVSEEVPHSSCQPRDEEFDFGVSDSTDESGQESSSLQQSSIPVAEDNQAGESEDELRANEDFNFDAEVCY